MAHTPGPWREDPNTSASAGRAIEARAFDGSWHYVVDRVRGGNPTEAKANARLIASAPELLASLKSVVSFLEHERAGGYLPEARNRVLADARRYIAKAEADPGASHLCEQHQGGDAEVSR